MKRHIGLLGCGNWGHHILRDLKRLGCEVTVVDPAEQGRARAAEIGADRILDSLGGLPEMDGFVVATPTALHAETVAALLESGRPIFVEKPFTNAPASARDLARRAGERIFVMHKWRYHPGVEALRDLARSQELGPVVSVRTFRLGWASTHVDVDASWILMPHDLSIALEILGYVPDPVFASAEYFNGELTGLLGILGDCPRFVAEVSARHATPVRSISVGFRDGTAVLEDSYSQCIQVRRALSARAEPGDPLEARAIPVAMPLERELRAFLEHLEGGPPPKTCADEAVRIVEVISQLRRLADVKGD